MFISVRIFFATCFQCWQERASTGTRLRDWCRGGGERWCKFFGFIFVTWLSHIISFRGRKVRFIEFHFASVSLFFPFFRKWHCLFYCIKVIFASPYFMTIGNKEQSSDTCADWCFFFPLSIFLNIKFCAKFPFNLHSRWPGKSQSSAITKRSWCIRNKRKLQTKHLFWDCKIHQLNAKWQKTLHRKKVLYFTCTATWVCYLSRSSRRTNKFTISWTHFYAVKTKWLFLINQSVCIDQFDHLNIELLFSTVLCFPLCRTHLAEALYQRLPRRAGC